MLYKIVDGSCWLLAALALVYLAAAAGFLADGDMQNAFKAFGLAGGTTVVLLALDRVAERLFR